MLPRLTSRTSTDVLMQGPPCRPSLAGGLHEKRGMPKETAVDGSIEIYGRLLKAFPDKKIVIGEFGWPSEGPNFEQTVADPISQAVILRNFAVRANARDID